MTLASSTARTDPGWRVTEARRRVAALRSDFALWCRTCYRIRIESGDIVPFVLNPVQRAIRAAEDAELAAKGRARIYVLKARQPGVTTYAQAANLEEGWSHQGRDSITLAHTTADTGKLFEITRRAIQNFPPSLLPRTGGAGTYEVSFPGRDSHFWTGTAGAKAAGRGVTISRLHCSEFALYAEPSKVLNGYMPAMEKVPGHVCLLETTPSYYDSDGHRFWKEARAGKNGFRAEFFPWWVCDPARYRLPLLDAGELGELTAAEKALRDRGLDLEQLKWRREKIGEYGTEGAFLNQYPEDDEACWESTGGLFYDVEILKALLRREPEPIATEYGGALEIFGHLRDGETVMRGVDTAEGVGGDRSAYVDRAFPSWRLLAVFQDNRIAPKEFAELLNKTAMGYGAECFQVVEKNAHGITVLRELRDTHSYPLAQLYHRAPLDEGVEEARERIGWATTGESLPLLADAGRELLGACRDGYAEPPCASAVRDAFGVRRDDRGKIKLTGRDVWVSECLAWIGRSAPQQRKAKIWSSSELERQEREENGEPPPSPWQMPDVKWLGE